MRNTHGAGVFFYKKENGEIFVALGLRKINPNAGKWSFAGGNLDLTDQNYFECALREAREEFFNSDKNAFDEIPQANLNDKKKLTFNFMLFHWEAYFIDVTGIPIKFNRQTSEVIEIQWFSINNLPRNRQFLISLEINLAKLKGYLK